MHYLFHTHRDARTCTTTLPPLGTDQQYRLTTFSRSALPPEQEAVRLLIQTTFGPTRDSINDFVNNYGSDPAAFVVNQMALEPTLHRTYYRQTVMLVPKNHSLLVVHASLVKQVVVGANLL